MQEHKIIAQTKKWVKDVVIDLNFCPFAKAPYLRDQIRYVVASHDLDRKKRLQFLLEECHYLDHHDKVETTLLIFPAKLDHFYDFLDFCDAANMLLEDNEYEGIYQLATFHPDYIFHESDENDAANYTNRSPFPMLHLIRESSIDAALKSYKVPEHIPDRNMRVAREMGLDKMKALLQAVRDME